MAIAQPVNALNGFPIVFLFDNQRAVSWSIFFQQFGRQTLQLYDALQLTNGTIKVFGASSHVFGGTHSYCLINLSATGNFLSATAFEMDIPFAISYTDAYLKA